MKRLEHFSEEQLDIINNSVEMAEDLVCDYYKMSENQWLRSRYDVKTLADLDEKEIVHGHFAQVIRYAGQKKDTALGSGSYDFYKICLQDHSIKEALKGEPALKLLPFSLYIVTHELIHIVRFSRFLQMFDATDNEKLVEESRVHEKTHNILSNTDITGLKDVLSFYKNWRMPID